MTLEAEIAAARAVAGRHLEPGEELVGVVPAEPAGVRVYVCGYAQNGDERWLAFDSEGTPVSDRALVRDAVSIAALCELAEESAGGGDIAELRARLVELRGLGGARGDAPAATSRRDDRLSRRHREGGGAARASARRERRLPIRSSDEEWTRRG